MKDHIKILDFLRGFAALGVVLFHFSNSTLPTIKPNGLSDIFYYGKFGVQAFFVISGLVIPYSMVKSQYVISDYFKTLLGRFIRISPPAYFAILLTFILYFSCILILGRPINGMDWPGININSIIGNLTYTVPYLNTSWFNPVFWTLAIEFQFYIIIGVLLPIIMTKKVYNIVICLLILLLIGFIDFNWFFQYVSFFILGVILFLKKEKLVPKLYLIFLSIITTIICFFQSILPEFIFGFTTFALILLGVNLDFKFPNYLGKISYSLYITHSAIGLMSEIVIKRIINIHESPIGKILMLFVYTGITILFASIFYRYMEKPFIIYAKKIKLSLTKPKQH